MFIGRGAKRRTLGNTYPMMCPYCQNSVYYNLIKIRKRYWILLPIPYDTDWYLECPICDYAIDLTDEQADMAQEIHWLAEDYLSDDLSEGRFTQQLGYFDKMLGVDRVYEAQAEIAGAGVDTQEVSGFQ